MRGKGRKKKGKETKIEKKEKHYNEIKEKIRAGTGRKSWAKMDMKEKEGNRKM